MGEPQEELLQVLQRVLINIHEHPYPHVPNPDGSKKRASVALILRIRPAYSPTPVLPSPPTDPTSTSSSLSTFFSHPWVLSGDPEVLFIKRAGRAGDRWSGHVALPGGKRDGEDASDLAAAVRESHEEVGLDLASSSFLPVGNLPERVVMTTWGKDALMVLCPFIFLQLQPYTPPLALQPSEIAAVHWIPLRALLSPALRTHEYVDVSSRFGRQGGPLARAILRLLLGKMQFSAIMLLPSESHYASSSPSFLPSTLTRKPNHIISTSTSRHFGIPLGTTNPHASTQSLLLWGLTLGVLADFLATLPPYSAVALWTYPTFTPWDLHALIYLFTFSVRKKNTPGDLSAGTWPRGSEPEASETGIDGSTQAAPVPVVSEAEPRGQAVHNTVGIGGLGVGSSPKHAVGKMLSGYYERMNVAIAVFLAWRAVLGVGMVLGLIRAWRRRRARL